MCTPMNPVDAATCRLLPESYSPCQHTVVVAKGGMANTQGNAALRSLCVLHIAAYMAAKNKNLKTAIVSRILEEIQDNTPDRVGFVRFHDGGWYECNEQRARNIISARLRDCTPDKFKSSNKNKAQKRRESKKCKKPVCNPPDIVPPSPISEEAKAFMTLDPIPINYPDEVPSFDIPLHFFLTQDNNIFTPVTPCSSFDFDEEEEEVQKPLTKPALWHRRSILSTCEASYTALNQENASIDSVFNALCGFDDHSDFHMVDDSLMVDDPMMVDGVAPTGV